MAKRKMPIQVRTRYTEQSFRDDVASLGLLRPPLQVYYQRGERCPWEVHYNLCCVINYYTKKEAIADIACKCADLQEPLG